MQRKELIGLMFEQLDGSVRKCDLDKALDSLIHVAREQLVAGNSVDIRGLGILYPGTRKERPGRNPKTGKPCLIPERKTITIRLSKVFEEMLNGK